MSEFLPTYALIANGAIEDYAALLPSIKAHEGLICVDGGLSHCHKMGLTPDMIMGDLDSISPELLQLYEKVPTRSFPCNKDESDLELAIQSVYTPDLRKITVFGALGKRLDHTLSNLHLMRRYPRKVFFETEFETIFAFDENIEIPTHLGQTISFIQIGEEVSGVSSEGLKWNIQDANFGKYYFSLSNICLGEKTKISLKTGDLICILQK